MIPFLGRMFDSENVLPFDMFERELTADQAKAAGKLERLYHKGQRRLGKAKPTWLIAGEARRRPSPARTT